MKLLFLEKTILKMYFSKLFHRESNFENVFLEMYF